MIVRGSKCSAMYEIYFMSAGKNTIKTPYYEINYHYRSYNLLHFPTNILLFSCKEAGKLAMMIPGLKIIDGPYWKVSIQHAQRNCSDFLIWSLLFNFLRMSAL